MEINELLKEIENNNIFLTGAGGTGKSFNTEKIIQRYKGLRKNVVVLGSTGIAASNIGGQTIHSFFKIGLSQSITEWDNFMNTMKPETRLSVQKKLDSIIPYIDLLIIDEVSMVSADLFDLIVMIMEMYNFKGRVLLVGDFYQLPPVKNPKYCFESDAWINKLKLKTINLNEIYRTKDSEFIDVLNNIRIGRVEDKDINYLQKLRLNKERVKNQLPTILAGTNKEALKYNKLKLEEQQGTLHTYKWKLVVNNTGKDEIHREYWKKAYNKKIFNFCNSLICEENLQVKVGSLVMFISNGDRFYNGEKGRILEIRERLIIKDELDKDFNKENNGEVIEESLVIEKLNGELVELYRTRWELVEYEGYGQNVKKNEIAYVYQYPIKLGHSITIHKAQGMSIDNLICDITNIFEDSQFYVSISRAINPSNTYIHYKGTSFENYIRKITTVNEKVNKFYENGKE